MSNLLTQSSVMMCPHNGTVQVEIRNTRARADGDLLLRASDRFEIVGCKFNVSGSPHPCIEVQWQKPTQHSTLKSDFTLNESSEGICLAADGALQGTVQIQFTQASVSGR